MTEQRHLHLAHELEHAAPDPGDVDAYFASLTGEQTRPTNGHASTAEAGGFALDILTARELYNLPDPPTDDMLLGPLVVRRYRTIIAGGSGEGKTTFAFHIIRALTTGGDLLGWNSPGGQRVLVIDLEQGLRTVKRRLHEADLHQSDLIDYARIPDGLALDKDETQRDALEQLLTERNYATVLLDPFYKAHRGDSMDERAIVDLMRVLDHWREKFGFALILPAHTRKKLEPSSKLTIDDIFGSGAFVRGAELVIGLQRVSAGFARIYWFKDRDGEDESIEVGGHWNLLFDRDTGYRRDPADTAPARDLPTEIETWLTEHPNSTTNAVAEGVGAGRDRVSQVLKKDDRFTYQPGSNRSRLWVAQTVQTHPGHPATQEAFGGGRTGGPSIEGHHQVTHASSASTTTGHSPTDDLDLFQAAITDDIVWDAP